MNHKAILTFFLGGIAGIFITICVVSLTLPYSGNDSHFANFPKSCIVSDIGAEYQVYCPN